MRCHSGRLLQLVATVSSLAERTTAGPRVLYSRCRDTHIGEHIAARSRSVCLIALRCQLDAGCHGFLGTQFRGEE